MALAVAVTGGIGAGKSTVARALSDRGAVVVDSDRLAREVVAPGTPGLDAVRAAFGPDLISSDGTLDRPAMASRIFGDPAARRRLEGIIHPLVRAGFAAALAAAAPGAVVVNDIPLLVDPTAAAAFHLVLGVHAPVDARVARLRHRGLTEADALARIAAQLPDEDREPLCDLWWANDAAPAAMTARAAELFEQRLQPFAANLAAGRAASRGSVTVTTAGAVRRLSARLAAVVGFEPAVESAGRDGLVVQVETPDEGTRDRWIGALAPRGFFPRDVTARDRADRLGSADPGQNIDLQLSVRLAPGGG